MLEFLKKEANKTYTENGALTNISSFSNCLDLFATVGALRNASDEEVIARFMRAFAEDPDTAMKILFFARDIRGGLGERRIFRTVLKWLAENEADSLNKNIGYIAEYGRFDDLLCLFGTPCEKAAMEFIRNQFDYDFEAMKNGKEVSLLGKWLPSVNASSKETVLNAKKIVKYFETTDCEYRKKLVALRKYIKIIENNLREKDYTFDYEKQPSRALFKYRKAFGRNDAERYGEFIGKVQKGEAKLNASNVMPYELVEPYLNDMYYTAENRNFMRPIDENEGAVLNATWKSLPDFCDGRNALAVVDTSGSMYWGGKPLPAAVALSLGIYFAEHNEGVFKNHFIEFSAEPTLIEIKGKDFTDKLRYCASFNKIANTNIMKVFDLILNTAVNNHLPQKELPETLYIISDMEFDRCIDGADVTNFELAKLNFARRGYKLPKVVFWNVQSRNTQQPVTMNEQGVALVSGCTPRLFSMVMEGDIDPYHFMMEVIGNERYAKIAA